jgi:hypothetical protein
VRDGTYPDAILIQNTVALVAYPPSGINAQPYPSVGPITIQGQSGTGRITLWGLHVLGAVNWIQGTGNPNVTIDACRVDGGVNAGWTFAFVPLRMRGCLVFGNINASPLYYPDITGCTVIGGGILVFSHGGARVRDNYVRGPAAVGIQMCCDDAIPNDASGNIVIGTTDGIVAWHGTQSNNIVEDVSGSGLKWPAAGATTFQDNTVTRAGQYGILFSASGGGLAANALGNSIHDSGLDGIRANGGSRIRRNNVWNSSGAGIRITDAIGAVACDSNVVMFSGSDGIVATTAGSLLRNVVGRSQGNGIAIGSGAAPTSNTSYLNGGSGYEVTSVPVSTSIANNIGYGNSTYGIHWSGGGSAPLACNDWDQNGSGATGGTPIGGTDLQLDPLFCNLAADDVSLASSSPLVSAGACGLIGALGVGCATASVGSDEAKSVDGLNAYPQPGRGTIRFAWPASPAAGALEIFDIAGARLKRLDTTPGTSDVRWSGDRDDGVAATPGVYWARWSDGTRQLSRRVVLVD